MTTTTVMFYQFTYNESNLYFFYMFFFAVPFYDARLEWIH